MNYLFDVWKNAVKPRPSDGEAQRVGQALLGKSLRESNQLLSSAIARNLSAQQLLEEIGGQAIVVPDPVQEESEASVVNPEKMAPTTRHGVRGQLGALLNRYSNLPADPNSSPSADLQEPSVEQPKKKGRLAGVFGSLGDRFTAATAKGKIDKKKILIFGGVAAALLIFAVILIVMVSSSAGGQGGDEGYLIPPPATTTPLPEDPAAVAPSPDQVTDDSNLTAREEELAFWDGLVSIDVPEYSPGILGWRLTAQTAVGILLMIALTIWAIAEGNIRKKGQNNALLFSILAVITGWLTTPVLVIMAKAESLGILFLGMAVLGVLWGYTISTISSQGDYSPTTVALTLFSASLFYHGRLEVVASIGALFNQAWPVWSGITSLGGVATLLFTGRASEAMLTIFVMLVGFLAIFLAIKEVGKKHSWLSGVTVALAVVVVYLLLQWLFGMGIDALIASGGLSQMTVVIFRVLAPIFSWGISLGVSVLIGTLMGDVEVGQADNRIALGIQKTGGFIQNIADFAILGTVVPLFLLVIFRV